MRDFAPGAHRDRNLVDAEGRGLLPALALAPDGASSDLLLRLGLRLALGIRVDPVDLRLPAQLLREEVVDGPGLLHAVQGLDVRGSGGPRGVAVRASARLGAPAEHVRGSVDSSLDRPSRDHGRRGPRGHQSPVAAPAAPATARAPSPRAVRAPPVSTAAAVSAPAAATSAAEAKPSVASASATCCEAKRSMSCAAWRSTSAALCPARCSRGSTSLGLPMIWGAGTSSGGGASPGGRLGMRSVRSSQSPPPRSTFMVWFSDTLLTAAAAPAAPPATIASAA